MVIMTKTNVKLRISSAILILLMLLSFVPITANAAAEYSADGATSFVFSDGEITVTEGIYSGYKTDGTALTISESGTYIVSGSCSDGSIKIKKGTTGVTLVLNGISLTSQSTAPIACNKSSEVNIVVVSGTVNTLTDNALNNDESYPDNENAENAVIKCKDGSKVTIDGSGTLNITANGKNGIKSGATTEEEGEASLTIRNVTLNITASVNDAINAEQLLNIESGNLNISAADDAIHCDLEMNVGASGAVGPVIKIATCYEGLEAATLNIFSGNISILSSDDCLNAANSDLSNYSFSMNISGGTIVAYSSSGDGFDSNGSMTISGGTVIVWTANTADNEPLDADGTITVSGGTVLAAGGSAGMGMNLNASQAYVIYGASANMGGGRPGGMRPGGQGGNFGPQRPGNQDNENDGQIGFPDGQQPGNFDESQQPPQAELSGNFIQSEQSGSFIQITKDSEIVIKDESGNVLLSSTAFCNASYVFFSSSELSVANNYTLYSDNAEVATSAAQSGSTSGAGGNLPANPGNGQRPDQPDFPSLPGNNATDTPSSGNEDTVSGDGNNNSSGTGKTTDSNSVDGYLITVIALASVSVIAILAVVICCRKKSAK